MDEVKNDENIEFRFVGVQITSKNMPELIENNIVPADFIYEVKLDTRIQAERNIVIMSVRVKIMDAADINHVCASYTVWCLFHITEFEKFIIMNKDGLYVVPQVLEVTIRPVSISTVRGIIYSDLKNTYLCNTIMPVVYMDQFITDQPSN